MNKYRAKFVKNLPIDNFFQWCLDVKLAEQKTVNHEAFNQVSNVLFQEDEIENEHGIKFKTEFLTDRIEIDLSDVVLDMPVVKCSVL